MTPKQRGGGSSKFGNTSHGHRSNRVNSTRRGGNPHAGGGGGKKGGCVLVLVVLGAGAAVLTDLATNYL